MGKTRAKIPQELKIRILAEYYSPAKYGGKTPSLSTLAKTFNVSERSISTILKDESLQTFAEKFRKTEEAAEEEATKSMQEYIDGKLKATQDIMSKIYDILPQKVEKAYFKDLISALEKLAAMYIGKGAEGNNGGDSGNKQTIEFVFTDTSTKNEDNSTGII